MLKFAELRNPDSCMSKARDDEMTFVLLSRDSCAPETIRHWCRLRVFVGKNKIDDPQIVDALACADEMDRQREALRR